MPRRFATTETTDGETIAMTSAKDEGAGAALAVEAAAASTGGDPTTTRQEDSSMNSTE
jgi:hypothetical protein